MKTGLGLGLGGGLKSNVIVFANAKRRGHRDVDFFYASHFNVSVSIFCLIPFIYFLINFDHNNNNNNVI